MARQALVQLSVWRAHWRLDHWLLAEYERGAISEAVALVPARVDTRWFARLDHYPQCHFRGRLRFNGAGTAPFPSAVVYLGANVDGFVAAYRPFGRMVRSLL